MSMERRAEADERCGCGGGRRQAAVGEEKELQNCSICLKILSIKYSYPTYFETSSRNEMTNQILSNSRK